MEKTSYFWFRRDLRLNDNTGLNAALQQRKNVQPIFIFDTTILADLPQDDARVSFIWKHLNKINSELQKHGSSLLIKHGKPIDIWQSILESEAVDSVYLNRDYEPAAIARDKKVKFIVETNGAEFQTFKDHVFFENNEVLKGDDTPYTVFTPYKNKWLEKYAKTNVTIPKPQPKLNQHYAKTSYKTPTLESIGFKTSTLIAPNYDLNGVDTYDLHRDYPAKDKTTLVGHHLRFGTISVRSLIYYAVPKNKTYLSEIIWRDFFSQILAHFPNVLEGPFKPKYAGIEWRNDEKEFKLWCEGKTGYPIVDAGMRQLNETGFMHNRVRMVTASFLIKHLLIDWRWGEAYFAEKLLDFDLASNNGNWQWAAGTGCDSAPYFRVFNPTLQQERFDKQRNYIKRWIPDFDPDNYIDPIVDHKMARVRAIETYKHALQEFGA
ncbi:MAG: deoxyribodipyrimidine photo-lyase [Crocinitomix sp.]|nr:deoxyribodipyrimidine photo-lyase [Crocinitomix sp.]